MPILVLLISLLPFSYSGVLVCKDTSGLEIRGNISSGTGSALFGGLSIQQNSKKSSSAMRSIEQSQIVGYWNHRGALLLLALDPVTLQPSLELNVRCKKMTLASLCVEKTGTYFLYLKQPRGQTLQKKAGTPIRCTQRE